MRICRFIPYALALALYPVGYAQEAPQAKPQKYPLRLHVLAIDDLRPTVRLQPNWCSGSIPDVGGGVSGADGGGAAPCSSGASFGGDDDLSGAGRGDLVTPPTSTQGLHFTYDGCTRVRVEPGFQGLPARWKKQGKKLEVLIPTDELASETDHLPTRKCTLSVSLHEFVYLRMPTGKILQVDQEAYWRKPALRAYLSGGTQTLRQRPTPVVSVKELAQPKE